jgi:hypothetical protein
MPHRFKEFRAGSCLRLLALMMDLQLHHCALLQLCWTCAHQMLLWGVCCRCLEHHEWHGPLPQPDLP